MDGHTPAPQPSQDTAPATSSEVDALKSRMEQLENHIVRLVDLVNTNGLSIKSSPTSHTTYSTPFYNGTPTASQSKSTALDRTFLALDDLSRGYTESPNGTPRNESAARSDISQIAWPSVFLSNSFPQPSARSTQNLFDIASALPKQEIVNILVDYHLNNDGVFWHFVQDNVFRAELSQFSQVRFTPSLILVDPAWLALLVAMLSLLHETDLVTAALIGDRGTIQQMDEMLVDAFDTAMYASRIFHKPQVRILQALLILESPQQQGRFLNSRMDHGIIWHDLAVSIPDHQLPSDPAFPPHLPLYTREWSSRLAHNLLFVDMIAEAIETDRRDGAPSHSIRLAAGEVITPRPRNFRDEDLWSPGAVTQRTEPHPSFVLTEVSWQIHAFQVAHYWKIISELIRDPTAMTPELVKSIDSQLRQGDYELLSLRASHQLSPIQDLLLESFHGSYQQRVLRLHRHYFMRSYSDQTYDFSQTAALTAARAIIKGHKDVFEKKNMYSLRFATLVFFSHHMSAAVLLFIHGCLNSSARQGIERELKWSLDLFEQAQPPNGTGDQSFWHLSVGRGRIFIEAMLNTLSSNPPTDLRSIENYMMELNRRGVERPAVNPTSPSPEDLQQFSLPALFSLLDGTAKGNIQDNDMLQDPAQLDWDSMFMGF
ncbi:hypothetical protein V865_005133 [Kwoniella europaea PYCC6329]|uniref:Transcription factor domain-containing protein n=1 Tax=Kwoniella europaea PYCC6329 TaxID=1423913 RepID=A0AAX4KKQ0_9TREE